VTILTVVGARPQFIKAAAVSRTLRRQVREILVHTGQHYDAAMSDRFFQELEIPVPDRHLAVGSGAHGEQTGRMLAGIERAIVETRPDKVLVYGDTNSTLAGALAAAKLQVPVIHIEAGLRSFNRAMPEEINRVLVDHVSDLLCCPSPASAANLAAEGIARGVHVTGDVMRDLLDRALPAVDPTVLDRYGVRRGGYVLLTIHRAGNTDDLDRLRGILAVMSASPDPVIFPVHPRTRQALGDLPSTDGAIRLIEPVGYLEMLALERDARLVATDSGGVQKEAYWLGVRCATLRDETEWTETVDAGWNCITGCDPARIRAAIARDVTAPSHRPPLYGDGRASERIAELILSQ
jgi:UDP-GlcNAc3NAcA epimerase